MKFTRKQWLRAVVAGSVGPLLAAAATSAAHGADADNPNRFNASGRFLFNVKADFMHLATPANPGPGVGVHAGDHVYDDGYVKVDESGNAGNATWNWGFQKPSSVVGTSLELHSSRSPADGLTQRKSDEPQSGFEVSYGRVLKSVDVCGKPMRLGLLGAVGMTFLEVRNNSAISGATTGVKDTYDLSGLPLIPNAPYAGSTPVLGGPLPLLLPDAPTARTPINVAATANGAHEGEWEPLRSESRAVRRIPGQRRRVRAGAGRLCGVADGRQVHLERGDQHRRGRDRQREQERVA